MAFILEKDMTNLLYDNINSFLYNFRKEGKYPVIAKEVPALYRMIDVVIASLSFNTVSNSLSYFKYLNTFELEILALCCSKKKVSINRLKEYSGLEGSELNIHLSKLIKYGLIEKLTRLSYIPGEWTKFIPDNIISIELKLSDWQEALQQGIYNLSFSDYSYVILDEEKVPVNRNIEEYFYNNNVGLIYLKSDSSCKFIVNPKKNNKVNLNMQTCQKVKILKDLVSNKKWTFISEG